MLLREDRAHARAHNDHDGGVSLRAQRFDDLGAVLARLNLRAHEMQGAMLNAQRRKLPRRLAWMRRRHEVLRDAPERAG